jgi:hypothetical protein
MITYAFSSDCDSCTVKILSKSDEEADPRSLNEKRRARRQPAGEKPGTLTITSCPVEAP